MLSSWPKHIITFLIALAVSLPTTASWGQLQNSTIKPKVNSPLSRFGLGDPLPQYFAASAGMGGLGTAWRDPFHLNLQNPAALASLQATAFEGGLYLKNSQLSSADSSDNIWGGNLQYLALGFPLRNAVNRTLDRESDAWNAGMAFSLSPLTQVGYDLLLRDRSSPGVALSTNSLKGSGGLTKFGCATGGRYQGFSFGAEVGFVFGKIINSRLVFFDSLPGALQTEFLDDLSVRATTFTFGAQYAYNFIETDKNGDEVPTGKRVIAGAVASLQSEMNTDGVQFTRRFLSSGSGTTLLSDTIRRATNVPGTAKLPGSLSLGLHYQDDNKLNLGIEYGMTSWSNYENSLKPENLMDSYHLAVGAEYIPNFISYNNYWERVRYRLGFRYATDARTLGGTQISGVALTMGLGFPIILPRQQVSFINLALELGRSGVDGILEETYARINLGFTLNDNSWFFKRKFN
ncbi:MAG: hypothetical protein D6772_01090 [Bacteroidetes bacterium]|nr:MAG: hypothetical protein D6772_01090 [Bacteroidota bacterium]